MSGKEIPIATRRAKVVINDRGIPQAVASTTPVSDRYGVEVNVPFNKAIPIIFLPGVMGSPLRATGENAKVMGPNNKWAWYPDQIMEWILGTKPSELYDNAKKIREIIRNKKKKSVFDIAMEVSEHFQPNSLVGNILVSAGNAAKDIMAKKRNLKTLDDAIELIDLANKIYKREKEKYPVKFKKQKGFIWLRPKHRKELLDPKRTAAVDAYSSEVEESVLKSLRKKLKQDGKAHDGQPLFNLKEARRRGWATVMESNYTQALIKMERTLRQLSQDGLTENQAETNRAQVEIAVSEILGEFSSARKTIYPKASETELDGTDLPFEEALKKHFAMAGQYQYPVFAVGYNWLKSCDDAAQEIYNRIAQIVEYVRKEAPPDTHEETGSELDAPKASDPYGLGLACDEVIIVTHSMGGLVGRALAQIFDKKSAGPAKEQEQKSKSECPCACGKESNASAVKPFRLRGVIHGVQPCNGAAAVYARMRSGWEAAPVNDEQAGWFFKKWMAMAINWGMAMVLAKNSKFMASIATQSPGIMQIAPNTYYKKGWLRINDGALLPKKKRQMQEAITDPEEHPPVMALPQENPYDEIYKQREEWTRLTSDRLVAPEAEKSKKGDQTREREWQKYLAVVDKAQEFHEKKLDRYFFKKTFFIHSKSEATGRLAYGDVVINVSPVSALAKEKGVAQEVLKKLKVTSSPTRGKDLTLGDEGTGRYKAQIQDPLTPGDGTVPYFSANPLDGIEPKQTPEEIGPYIFEYQGNGVDHQAAFDNDKVLNTVLTSVVSLAGKAHPANSAAGKPGASSSAHVK